LEAPVEEVKKKEWILQTIFTTISNWFTGSCIIEGQISLSNFLNIFIPFMKAKRNNEDYTICGFKLLDMCLGDHLYLRGKTTTSFQEAPMDSQGSSADIEAGKLDGVASDAELLLKTAEQYVKEESLMKEVESEAYPPLYA
jgi:hypothetical protein